jgi:hypothetical protein
MYEVVIVQSFPPEGIRIASTARAHLEALGEACLANTIHSLHWIGWNFIGGCCVYFDTFDQNQ